MITVPEAAQRAGKDPETIRRWIRTGRLRARKIGTQHVIEEDDLEPLISAPAALPAPGWWDATATGEPMPDWVSVMREQRDGH